MVAICPVYAQEIDTVKLHRTELLKSRLDVSLAIAERIDSVMIQYKKEMKKVIAELNLDEKTRRARIDQLIDVKNRMLSTFLTQNQLRKVVPTTERRVLDARHIE